MSVAAGWVSVSDAGRYVNLAPEVVRGADGRPGRAAASRGTGEGR